MRWFWIVLVLLVVVVVFGAGALHLRTNDSQGVSYSDAELWTVRRGDLKVTVSEGGALQAENIERIRSQVPQSATIIYLIPEGTIITEKDVEEGKLLVELDASGLKERFTQQEISVNNSAASYTKAKEDFEIQEKQNASDIRSSKLEVKFARMELAQYVGETLQPQFADATDYAALARDEKLGGAALKKRTELENNVSLAREEVQRAKDKVDWTKKLYEQNYVTRNELMADELALKRQNAELEQAKLATELFLTYELPKEAESKYAEWQKKILDLQRVEARAISERAAAQANLKSAESTYRLEKNQLEELAESIENCVIRATKPGLVIYASSTSYYRRRRNPIEEGESVREREEILHIPDLSSLIAEVKLHEGSVKKVEPGQTATIKVDAYPELDLTATVTEVASLPDPQHWLQNVNMYNSVLKVDGTHPSLKPGMSCRAEIVTAQVDDTLYVPVQSVTSGSEGRVCYVVTENGAEPRPVKVSAFDDRFAAIESGLEEGMRILISPPLFTEAETAQSEDETGEADEAPGKSPRQQGNAPETAGERS